MPFQRLVVLIPQRDAFKKIKTIKENLFSQGNVGVWSFPPVIPLAKFSAPLQESALKHIAVQIRSEYAALSVPQQADSACHSSQNSGDFRQTGNYGHSFNFEDFAVVSLDTGISLWGLRLDVDLPELKQLLLETGAAYLFETFILVLGIAPNKEASQNGACKLFHPDKKFCFYTAALANMVFAPLPIGEQEYSFCWKIGKPIWLPKKAALPPHSNEAIATPESLDGLK